MKQTTTSNTHTDICIIYIYTHNYIHLQKGRAHLRKPSSVSVWSSSGLFPWPGPTPTSRTMARQGSSPTLIHWSLFGSSHLVKTSGKNNDHLPRIDSLRFTSINLLGVPWSLALPDATNHLPHRG